MYGKVTGTAFATKMREELKVWTDRQRSVPGVESTPAKARSPIPADRVHDVPSSLTGKRDPSLPAIATLALVMGSVATPAPMDVAGPSTNCRQVSQQEADDRRMAENLETALREDEPMSFRDLNRSESATEGDDEDDESEGKGKGKAKKIPIKGRVKAGGGGITRVIWSSPEIEDKKAGEPQDSLRIKVKGGRQPPKGTGVYYARPCETCAQRSFRCEKTDARQPPCVTCKRMKVKCSHVGS